MTFKIGDKAIVYHDGKCRRDVDAIVIKKRHRYVWAKFQEFGSERIICKKFMLKRKNSCYRGFTLNAGWLDFYTLGPMKLPRTVSKFGCTFREGKKEKEWTDWRNT